MAAMAVYQHKAKACVVKIHIKIIVLGYEKMIIPGSASVWGCTIAAAYSHNRPLHAKG